MRVAISLSLRALNASGTLIFFKFSLVFSSPLHCYYTRVSNSTVVGLFPLHYIYSLSPGLFSVQAFLYSPSHFLKKEKMSHQEILDEKVEEQSAPLLNIIDEDALSESGSDDDMASESSSGILSLHPAFYIA